MKITEYSKIYAMLYEQVINHLEKNGYKFLAEGGARWTYVSPDKTHVIKIPKSNNGEIDNKFEFDSFKTWGKSAGFIQQAECEMVTIADCKVLKMEYIEPIKDPYALGLDWVYSVDCGQVGYDSAQKVVAYDYA